MNQTPSVSKESANELVLRLLRLRFPAARLLVAVARAEIHAFRSSVQNRKKTWEVKLEVEEVRLMKG